MNSHNLDSLMRSRTRHEPPPELDARVRRMIATHPRHGAAPYAPGPFTWRDWYHVALALSLVPIVILSFHLAMPSDKSVPTQPPLHQRQMTDDDDWSQTYLTEAAGKSREEQLSLFRFMPSDAKPPDG